MHSGSVTYVCLADFITYKLDYKTIRNSFVLLRNAIPTLKERLLYDTAENDNVSLALVVITHLNYPTAQTYTRSRTSENTHHYFPGLKE
jgi:hypothetical protein